MAGPFSIFSGMGSGSQSGKLLLKSFSALNFDISKIGSTILMSDYFLYNRILFVDPNGTDATAVLGNINRPWKTIAAASDYIESNSVVNGLIYIFPGTYTERIMSSQISKGYHLLPGTTIFPLSTTGSLIQIANCAVTITSDSKFDCIIGTGSRPNIVTLFGGGNSQSTCVIENTKVVTSGFSMSGGDSFSSSLEIRNSILDIDLSPLTMSTTPAFTQGDNSTIYINTSKIYSNFPDQTVSLVKTQSDLTGSLLHLSNTYLYARGTNFRSFIETSTNSKNNIFINNCFFHVSESFLSNVVYSDSGSTYSNYVITLGNNFYNVLDFFPTSASSYLTFSDDGFLFNSAYRSNTSFENSDLTWSQFFDI